MRLFKRKKKKAVATQQPLTEGDVIEVADELFDEQFREELRQIGREHFKKLIDEQSGRLGQEVETTMSRVSIDLREYLQKQLDVTISRINQEITEQLNERISDYTRVSGEAQELVAQSLSRNAQMVYEKYQQMTTNLQQIVASQEVMMVTVFQDNKANISNIQSEQSKILESIRQSAILAGQQSEQLSQILRQNASTQARKLGEIYRESIDSVQATRNSQDQMLVALRTSVQALEGQYQQLSSMLDQSIANQKKMMSDAINDNLARIVEHYLMDALGERSNLRAELPAIIEQLESSKQAMKDDMQL